MMPSNLPQAYTYQEIGAAPKKGSKSSDLVALSFASALQAQERDPEVQALIDRAQKAWDTPPAFQDPVTERLFYRAAELERTTPLYKREEMVATVEEAIANKIGTPRFRVLSALYYPKDSGFVVCGTGRYYRSGQESNGAFIYSDLYGGIRIANATDNERRAYDCQSIANFRLR